MRSVTILMLLAFVVACSSEPEPFEPEEKPPAKGLIVNAVDSQKAVLDKAKQLEDDMLKAAEERKKKIDEESQ
ncbi:MAG: hypothetical protein DHS20C11_03750 [Lysobacteraceae bacterium]|nr:MAG: hypothetical protein DHS20C11_03750 [Xanthomonadaceae bacterium]